jgi:hypothetical protein
MPTSPHLTRSLGALGAAGILALGLTACGGSSSDSSSAAIGSASDAAATVKPVAVVKDTTGGITRVQLDAGFVKALGTLKLTPAPTGRAKISKGGDASFPITSGHITYYKPGSISPFVQGVLEHKGSGLSLTGGGTKVTLTNFRIDPGKSVLTGRVAVNGKVAAPSAPLFFLNGGTLKPLRLASGGKKAILEGTTVELKQEAADLLNKTFKVNALKAGLVIGIAKITIPVK